MAEDETPPEDHPAGPTPDDQTPPEGRFAGSTSDDLRDLSTAFEEHDRSQLVAAARQLRTDASRDVFGPTSFVPVFLLAMATVVLVPLAANRGLVRVLSVVVGAVMLWSTLSRARIHRRLRHIMQVVVVASVASSAAANAVEALGGNAGMVKALGLVEAGLFAVLLLVTTLLCLRELLHHESITVSSLGAAMSAYLMIGLLFVTLFGFAALLQDGAFFAQGSEPSPADLTYFSFITLTTVGYGDLTPVTSPARALVVAEAITGQIFLVTIVARVVSSYGQKRQGVQLVADEPTPAQLRAQRRAERRSRHTGDAEPTA